MLLARIELSTERIGCVEESMRWIVVLSVVLLGLGTGCSDDKEKSKKSAQTEPQTATEKSAPSERSTADKTAKTKLSGDKVATPKTAKPADKAAPKAASATNAKGLWGLDFTSDAIAVVGIQSFDDLYSLVSSKMKKYKLDIPLMSAEVVLTQAQQIIGTSDMAWFDRKESIKVVAWNPKKSSEMIYLIPITSKAAMIKALPKTARAGQESNSFTLTIEGRQLFINFLEKHAVICFDEKLFDQAQPFLSKAAKDFKPSGLLEVRVSVANLKRVFNTEVTMGLAMLSGLKAQLLQEDIGDEEKVIVGKIIDKGIGLARSVVTECQGLKLAFGILDDGSATVELAAQGSAGGKMAAFSTALSQADLRALNKVPKDSWLVVASDWQAEDSTGLSGKALSVAGKTLASGMELKGADEKKLNSMLTTFGQLKTDLSWMAVYPDQKFPAGLTFSVGAKDGKRHGEVLLGVLGFLYEKGFDMVRSDLPPALQVLPADNFGEFVKAISEMIQPMGVTLSTKTESRETGGTYSLALTLDTEKAAAVDASNADNLRKLLKAFGTQFEFSLATSEQGTTISFGPTAGQHATQQSTGSAKVNREMETILAGLPKGTGVLVVSEAGRAFRLAQPLVEVFEPEQVKHLKVLPADALFLLSVSGEGAVTTLKVSVPLDAFVLLGLDAYQDLAPIPAK